MITINAFAFWAIISVVFILGFGLFSLFKIDDLEPRLTQAPEEPTKEQIEAAHTIIKQDGSCRKPVCVHCDQCKICDWFYNNKTAIDNMVIDSREAAARAWLASHGLPVEEPKEIKK